MRKEILEKDDFTFYQDYDLDINKLEKKVIVSEIIKEVEKTEPISQKKLFEVNYISQKELESEKIDNRENITEISKSCWEKVIEKQKKVELRIGGLNKKFYLNENGQIIEKTAAKFKRYFTWFIKILISIFLIYTGIVYPYYLSEKAKYNREHIIVNIWKHSEEVNKHVNNQVNKILEEKLEQLPVELHTKKKNLIEADFLKEITN